MILGIAESGFALCSLAFGTLVVLLRPGVAGISHTRLRIAAAAMVGWSAVSWWAAERTSSAWTGLLPIAVAGIWLWQLEALGVWQGQPRVLRIALRYSGVLALAALAAAPVTTAPAQPFLGLALCALGLFAIEQLYRNASAATESAIRWMGLGVGGLLVTELVGFAQSLLTRQPPQAVWMLRGYAYALCALAITYGARTVPNWSLGLAVSRQVAFYASSIILVGGYLLLMSIVASVMAAKSEGWGLPAQLAFVVVGTLALALALFARNLLRRWKVFISTHFYPHRYDYRAEWLRFTQTLAAATTAAVPERAIRAVAQIISSQQGSLWRIDEAELQYTLSARWPDAGETVSISADDVLPAYLAKSGWLIDLNELRTTPALYQDLKLDAARYHCADNALIIPLLHREQLYGWMVLDRPQNLEDLNFEDRDLLKIAGRQVAAHLAQFDSDSRLVQARQFETYNRMTAFVMHDLKNIAAQLRLISQNAERHRRNPEFVDDTFRTISGSATRMTKLVSQLASGTDSGTMQTVDLASAAERAAIRCSGQAPVPQVSASSRPLVFADLERLSAVIEHAIRNAQDATPPNGDVRIEVGAEAGVPILKVVDSGAGMDADFIRERLFRPFDTTKGTRGMGIGAFQIREYVTSLGGRVEVQSGPGCGTTLQLVFTRQPALAPALAG
ncbi:MAG: XrtA/PEP-CTERM system histidine kinase PrsK [Pseudomonadota bacterium]